VGSSASARTTKGFVTRFQIAEREGLDYKFEKVTIADAAHPNTVRINVELDGRKATMLGSSLGAGRILVQEIDGYPVEVTGNLHTIVLVAEDRKGSNRQNHGDSGRTRDQHCHAEAVEKKKGAATHS